MPWSLRAWLVLVLVVAAAGLGHGQGPKSDPKDTSKSPEATPKKTPLDKMKLPSGAILVVVEDLKEALSLLPKAFVMPAEKYQELLDEIAALKLQLKGDKKLPHACKLVGKAEGDFIAFDAEYVFSTEKPNTTVVLGLQGAHLTKEARLDGHVPALDFADDGFVVKVDTPGDHQLTLTFEVPVIVRRGPATGPERGFDLGLPGAAVTTVALELPAAVKDLRWNDNTEKKRRSGRWEFAPPAKTKTLNVSWKEPVTLPGTGPLLKATGQVLVAIDETQVLVTADLNLEPLRGQVSEWQLLLPPQATVEVKGAAGLLPETSAPEKKGNLTLIKLKDPTAELLHVVVQSRLPRLSLAAKMPIGPFAVIGAHQQEGTIVVKATAEALRGIRPVYHRHGEISQREPPKNPAGSDPVLASFQYWSLPGYGKGPAKGPKGVPLELELKPERGQIETHVEHLLRLQSTPDGHQVEATTRIKASALYGPVDFLDVQLPRLPTEPLTALTGLAPAPFPAALPWGPLFSTSQRLESGGVPIEYACQGEGGPELQPPDLLRRARIKLTAPRAKEFTVVLTGRYTLPKDASQARLELPRPLGILDRGGKVTASVVDDHLELLSDGGAPAEDRQQRSTLWDQAPRFVELAWRPYRPEFPVSGEMDIELFEGFARVRQQVHVELAPRHEKGVGATKKKILTFRIPPGVQGFKIGGKPPEEKSLARVSLSEPNETFELEYDFALPKRDPRVEDPGRAFEVPQIWPEQATRIDAKVRLWCEPGTVPIVADPDPANALWKDRGSELVAGRSSLPALVLHASGKSLPLQLRLHEPSTTRQVEAFIDRALIQAVIDHEGQHYRVRFVVRKFNAKRLSIELPAPVSQTRPSIYLDGRRSPYRTDGNVLAIKVDPDSPPAFLDMDYHLPRALLDTEPFWQTHFHPPIFKGQVSIKHVGWQIGLPPGLTPLLTSADTILDFRWALRNGVFTPDPVANSEFEGWPGAVEMPAADSASFWRHTLGPVRIVHVPWQAWFLICSGTLLVLGLGLSFAALPRLLLWLLLGTFIVGALLARFLWPSLFPMLVYGAQPGALLLVLILVAQWLLQERYRRQLVFMPGFKRVKAGSSLVRGPDSKRPREPSTVDAPPPSSMTGQPAPSQGT